MTERLNTFDRIRWSRWLVGAALVASLLGAQAQDHAYHGASKAPAAPPPHGFELPQPKALPAFVLADHRGAVFDRSRFEGRWTLLLFGFTHCTDICPTTLVALAEVQRQQAQLDSASRADVVFVSIDPKRDTTERLASYVSHFGTGITGVRGKAAEVDRLAAPMRVRYAPAGAAIDHTASVSLIGPDAQLYAVYSLPLQPDRLTADVARIQVRRCGPNGASARASSCTKGTV